MGTEDILLLNHKMKYQELVDECQDIDDPKVSRHR